MRRVMMRQVGLMRLLLLLLLVVVVVVVVTETGALVQGKVELIHAGGGGGRRARAQETVVVVGGGPVGLLFARELQRETLVGGEREIVVLEERRRRSRDVWFDLGGREQTLSPAQEMLRDGVLEKVQQVKRHEHTDTLSVRCKELEAALLADIETRSGQGAQFSLRKPVTGFGVCRHAETGATAVLASSGANDWQGDRVTVDRYSYVNDSTPNGNDGGEQEDGVRSQSIQVQFQRGQASGQQFEATCNVAWLSATTHTAASTGSVTEDDDDGLHNALVPRKGGSAMHLLWVPFDLLLVTDGARSRMRRALRISYPAQNTVTLGGGIAPWAQFAVPPDPLAAGGDAASSETAGGVMEAAQDLQTRLCALEPLRNVGATPVSGQEGDDDPVSRLYRLRRMLCHRPQRPQQRWRAHVAPLSAAPLSASSSAATALLDNTLALDRDSLRLLESVPTGSRGWPRFAFVDHMDGERDAGFHFSEDEPLRHPTNPLAVRSAWLQGRATPPSPETLVDVATQLANSPVNGATASSGAPNDGWQLWEAALSVPDLHQTTLIAKFRPDTQGQCPTLRQDARGEHISPFAPDFLLQGVTSVFKRFFFQYCEMQVLFTHEVGDRVFRLYQSATANATAGGSVGGDDGETARAAAERALWEVVRHVANVIIVERDAQLPVEPVFEIEEVVEQILHDGLVDTLPFPLLSLAQEDGDTPDVEEAETTNPSKALRKLGYGMAFRDVDDVRQACLAGDAGLSVFNIAIHQAEAQWVDVSARIPNPAPVTAAASPLPSTAVVVGDASITAHYRLGVGFNHAAAVLQVFQRAHWLWQSLRLRGPQSVTAAQWDTLRHHLNESLMKRTQALTRYQLFAMFMEAYCSNIVFGPWVFRHDYAAGAFESMPLTDALHECLI